MAHTGYFWLNDEQRHMMGAARASAVDYPFIGLFSVGKAWKLHVEAMVGSKVDPSNYLRAFNVTGSCVFGDYRTRKEVRAIIRLDATQATIFKLRHGGSTDAWLVADPTGESWGNMLIAQHSRKHLERDGKDGLYQPAGTRWAMDPVFSGHAFGPTLATVSTHCDALPIHMAVPCVNRYYYCWNDAHAPAAFMPPRQQSRFVYDKSGHRKLQHFTVDVSAFDTCAKTEGVKRARDFYQEHFLCQQELKDYYEL